MLLLPTMGSILSRFRAKPTTKELLEQIDADIQSIEDYKWTKMRQQKNLMALFFFGGGLIYAFAAILFYFYFLPRSSTFYDKIFYCLPLVVLPAIAYLLQRSLQWYFQWVIEGNEERLRNLRKEKRKILDRVMETETYKVAKELLEKFDPSSLKSDKTPPRSVTPSSSLRFRGTPVTTPLPVPGQQGMLPPNSVQRPGSTVMTQQMRPPNLTGVQSPQPRRFVRPILPAERSVVEKMVDYIVGDGPNNRYALICCFCHMHNGMALKYEFEYLAFRCCYCNTYNPPRKVRSNAPRIMPPPPRPTIEEPESGESDADRTSEADATPAKRSVDIIDISMPEQPVDKTQDTPVITTNESSNDEAPVGDDDDASHQDKAESVEDSTTTTTTKD